MSSIRQELATPAPEATDTPPPKSDRELLFEKAQMYEKTGQIDEAFVAYFNLTRELAEKNDALYDKSLFHLAKLYERNDQPEKAILALNELLKRQTPVYEVNRIRLLLVKNHYRSTNYYQAQRIRSEIDLDYKQSRMNINELFKIIFDETDLYYDHRAANELTFLGDVQKYFVFVMESASQDESEKSADLLKLYYENFISLLLRPQMAPEMKTRLAKAILDQLGRFEKYRIGDLDKTKNITKFSQFAEDQKLALTERLARGSFDR